VPFPARHGNGTSELHLVFERGDLAAPQWVRLAGIRTVWGWPIQWQPRYALRACACGEVPLMAEPADGTAGAWGQGRLRVSDSDREQAVDVLKDAFVHGRLSRDEFDARVTHAFTSRTHAELAAVTADLPAMRTAQPRTLAREQHGLTMKQAVMWSACMIVPTVTVTVTATAISLVIANRTDSGLALAGDHAVIADPRCWPPAGLAAGQFGD
jgi:hypothetical protein